METTSPASQALQPVSASRAPWLSFYAFVSIGVNASIIGPALPTFAARASVSLEQVGLLFTPFALGYATSVFIMSPISARMGMRALLLAGATCLLVSLALLLLGQSLPLIYLGAYLLGLGQSGTQVGYNSMVGLLAGHNAARMLNRLNAFFGVGALTGPLFVSLGYSLFDDASVAFLLALALSAPLWVGAWTWRDSLVPAAAHNSANPEPSRLLLAQLLRQPALWLLGIIASIYVSSEVAFSGWVAVYAERGSGVSAAQAALLVTFFFAAFTLGRYSTDLISRWVKPPVIVSAAIALTGAGLLVMIALPGMFEINLAGAFVVGFAMSPIYPILISYGIRLFPRNATVVTGFLTSMAALATLAIPSIVGLVMASRGITAAWGLLLLIVAVLAGGWVFLRCMLVQQLE
ncbi:MAG: MFS transporter [Candidatus Roseilinea sp.]|uniref:MFS transporter n=1 Tax=Candidatus Roseilinea sp. TaxID=2838777 RepID=UPI00404ADE94